MNEALKAQIDKIPVVPIVAAGLLYFAYGYYNFLNDPESPLNQKKAEMQRLEAQNTTMQNKIKEAREFVKSLETKRAELRKLASQLEELKASLSENMDVADFLKMTITEAKKVGLNVISLRPAEKKKEEFYTEQTFELNFRGVYVQLMVLLERLSQSQRIIRVESFNMKPIGSSLSRYVELEGTVQLKTYAYNGSKADQLGKDTAPIEFPSLSGTGHGQPVKKEGGK